MQNILRAGRRRRLLNGIVLSVATLGVAVALVVVSAEAGWFLLVFALSFLAAFMVLQAREGT